MGRVENTERQHEQFMRKQTTRIDVKQILENYDRVSIEPLRTLVIGILTSLEKWYGLPWWRRAWLVLRGHPPFQLQLPPQQDQGESDA